MCSGAEGSVLTFTSDELTEAVEWTGALRAKLFVRVGEGSGDASFLVRESNRPCLLWLRWGP